MAITEERPSSLPELPGGDDTAREQPLGVFARPVNPAGGRDWLTTIDHKKIGIMYGAAALAFFAIGGLFALIIRMQLYSPESNLVDADTYNQLFTMHATVMVFLVVMPMAAAFANFLVPLQIGARDVAFPRLNAFGFWCFLAGGIFLNLSWFLGGGADGGWFNYAPNSGVIFSPGHGIDFWVLGLQITGIASLTSAINIIVTIINMRAPGMSLMKMPVFTWMIFVVQFLLLFAIPVITVALFLLMFDRIFDANFFNVEAGADPLLWQHLFWIFGHPEVYILILPSFGIVSETLPVFSRKPLFGYRFIVISGAAIGFMGWGVWAHHMFASGIGPISVLAFSITTMFIAVPTGVKILNWIATMWGGKLLLNTPMLFSIGLVAMFTIGGLSGVSHAVSPADTQQTDTYYIVAHFHYVLFGGAIFGLMAGFYYWWPKVFGNRLGEGLGKVHFWLFLIGFNMTFGPMHILGLQGMSRRYYTYDEAWGFEFWNKVSTIGSFIIAAGFLVFCVNIFKSRNSPNAGADPWDARTIEWSIPSPAPMHNFDYVPEIEHLDDFWHRKYQEDENGVVRQVATGEELAQKGDVDLSTIHLPSPSYWPFLLALGLPFISAGLMYNLWISVFGGLLVVMSIYGWVLEPPTAEHDDHGHGTDDPDSPDDAVLVGAGAPAATVSDESPATEGEDA